MPLPGFDSWIHRQSAPGMPGVAPKQNRVRRKCEGASFRLPGTEIPDIPVPKVTAVMPQRWPTPILALTLTSGSSLLHSKGICHLIQGSLARAQSGVARKRALRAPVHSAVTIGRVQVPVREVREELGTVVETLGLSNVCRRQATGISQAAGHKTQSESLDASGRHCPALFTRSLSLALTD